MPSCPVRRLQLAASCGGWARLSPAVCARLWQGEYVDGVREGPGTYTKADGTVLKGEWKAGKLVE